MFVLPALSLNEDAVAFALATAISLVALIQTIRIPFKRQQHYLFAAFVGLVVFYFADHLLAEVQMTPGGFLSVLWWSEVLTPAPLLLALLYHAVLRNGGAKMDGWKRSTLIGVYAYAGAYIALAASNLSLFVSPVDRTPAGWAHGGGSLGPYLGVGGLEWPSVVVGGLILANLIAQYHARRSPIVRGQIVYIALGLGIYLIALQSTDGLRSLLVPPLPPLLESAGFAVMALGMTKHGFYSIDPVSETVSRTRGQFELADGRSYLGMDQESCFSAFSEIVRGGRNGLCITTTPPDEIRGRYLLKMTPIRWLANSEQEDAVDPGDLAGLSASLASFIARADRPVILLDGLDYLVSSNGFKPTMALVNKISQTNAIKGGIFLISSSTGRSAGGQPAILEVFEDVSLIQARLKGGGAVEVGENFLLQLDFFNIGKKPAYIDRVEDLLVPKFKVVGEPKGYKIKDSSLVMGGKRLEPFQLESVMIDLCAADTAGDQTIGGRVVFRDDEGIESSQIIEPVLIRVLQPQALELESEQARSAFAFLIEAFNKDYIMRKQPVEQSGWRSLSQVAEGAKISTSVLYGSEGKYGRPVYELLLRGLIEKRVFAQHRGRGGEAVKVRVSYDREPVRRYVDRTFLRRK